MYVHIRGVIVCFHFEKHTDAKVELEALQNYVDTFKSSIDTYKGKITGIKDYVKDKMKPKIPKSDDLLKKIMGYFKSNRDSSFSPLNKIKTEVDNLGKKFEGEKTKICNFLVDTQLYKDIIAVRDHVTIF